VNERSAIQSVASWAGTVLVVLGILGFVPGVTDNFSALKFSGHKSGAELFGVFDVSTLLNLVHVLIGAAGLWLARTREGARAYLVGGGAIYLALWIFGLSVSRGDSANFIPVDSADDWLHFAFGLLMIAAALALGRGRTQHATTAATR
jgi:Domain of unknown function (DUF4383)